MTKHCTDFGYVYYKTSLEDVFRWGGLGFCDICGEFHPEGGYLVPVLNMWLCKDCFDEWCSNSTYYPEDQPYEKQVCKYYEKLFGLVEST